MVVQKRFSAIAFYSVKKTIHITASETITNKIFIIKESLGFIYI